MNKPAGTEPYLPAALHAIAEVIGEEKTFELISKLGGTMVYVSTKPKDSTLLVEAIGHVAARKLGKEFGGERLDLPLGSKAVTYWLASKGLKNNEIARIQRCTAHTVGRRLNGKSVATPQLDLFREESR